MTLNSKGGQELKKTEHQTLQMVLEHAKVSLHVTLLLLVFKAANSFKAGS
jgi:hypothetical protein